MNRLVMFWLVVVITTGLAIGTSPWLVNQVKLGLDLKGGFEILYEAEPLTEGGEVTQGALLETAQSLERRANETGVAEPEITTEGKNRIRVKIAGVTDESKVREILKTPAKLTFRSAVGCDAAAGYCKTELVGDDFVEGGANIQQTKIGGWEITMKLKDADKFGSVTKQIAAIVPNNQLAIYMDETLVSAPAVDQTINSDSAVITGDFTREEAKDLADKINLGALPLKLTEKYTQSVGATLGKLSLKQTLYAGGIATVLILLFMIIFYRVPGAIASFTIVIFIWLLLLGFYLVGVTLTLPGIAAFILGIGMAVDANIIMAERIKEEMRSGKSLLSAHRAGSKRSFLTIIDAHVTTSIAAVVMFFIGTGAVKGFAVVLLITEVVSIATNVFFSRLLLSLLIRSNNIKKPSLLGVKESEISAL